VLESEPTDYWKLNWRSGGNITKVVETKPKEKWKQNWSSDGNITEGDREQTWSSGGNKTAEIMEAELKEL